MDAPKTVILDVSINDLLNNSGHSNVESVSDNFNTMIKSVVITISEIFFIWIVLH